MSRIHGIQEVDVFRGLHGDLGKEDCVWGKLCQAGHEFKAFCANRFELVKTGGVVLLFCQSQVGKRNGIKVVVSKRDEAESETAQLHDFLDHNIGSALPRTLSVSSPNGTERTMLGTTTDGLN